MTELLYKIFGYYTLQVIVRANAFFEMFLCIALFCWYFKRRKYFILRLILGFIVIFGVTLVSAVIQTHNNHVAVQIVCTLIISLLILGLLFVCFAESTSEILLCWCGGLAAFPATGAIVGIIYVACGIDDHVSISLTGNNSLDWFIYYILHISLYVLFSIVFSREKLRTGSDSTANTVILSACLAVLSIIISALSRNFESSELAARAMTKLLLAILSLLVLALRIDIFTQSKYKQDIKIMEELMHEDKKQFESMRSNIDVINMKCHDLKHRLSDLEGKLTESELNELKCAIEIYDTALKTGNDILDVVLYEKSLVCERAHISFTCMADGAALSFMSSSHIYSMIANALNNAVEAVSEIAEIEKRSIALTVKRTSGIIEITVANRYIGERIIANDCIQTTKSDKARHGYGIKSIKYIASLYDGKVDISAADGIFEIRILIPPPASTD